MPLLATTTLDPDSAKSVVSPDIVSVTALPSPPVVLTAETTVPAAAAQAIVGLDGVNMISSGAWMVIVTVLLAPAASAELPAAALSKAAAAIIEARWIISFAFGSVCALGPDWVVAAISFPTTVLGRARIGLSPP